MDLGLNGRTALVCASSDGLGLACAQSLAQAGARIVLNGRDPKKLASRADNLRRNSGAEVIPVAADVGTEDGRKRLLDAAGNVDVLVNNNGGPPPRPWRELDRDAMIAGIDANMWSAIALIQAVLDGMVERRFGRIVNITSSAVRTTLPGLELSTAARSGLTGFVAGIARDVAHANVTINSLLPGTFETARIDALVDSAVARSGMNRADIVAAQTKSIPAARFGDPAEFGATCAFLCSASAGYITGQNILIDGGAFSGVF